MHAFLLTVAGLLLIAGCSSSNDAPAPHKGIATLSLKHYSALDSTRVQYVLWLRSNGEWQGYPLPSSSSDSTFHISISSIGPIDSAKLSIEARTLPNAPTSVISAATITSNIAMLTSKETLPDLSQAVAVATFTTAATDTDRAKHEFYLMHQGAGDSRASVKNLPVPPSGWRYGIWVINANFVPAQNLFFGSFVSPQGASPDAFATSFNFPGGYYAGNFLSEGASIVVTLEPSANLAPRPHHGAPFAIMQGELHRFINRNDTVALSDVWMPPSAELVIQ